MKQMTGITRVSLRKRDGLIFVINDPEVLKSGSNENSYAIFGELKLEDPNSRLTQSEAKKFTEAKPKTESQPGEKGEEMGGLFGDDEGADAAPLSEEGLTPQHIDMVMQHANCSRNKAIKALRDSNDDMVAAVMKLTQ